MIRLGRILALYLCYLSTLTVSLGTYTHSEHGSHLIEDLSAANAGPLWVVQLSDLHFSSYRPQRALAFKKLLPPLLNFINPSLVLITGDLTDGKSKDLTAMRQDEFEWLQYRDAIEWVVSQSGLPEYRFFDIRGNHDKFGVPENGDWKHLFVGIDLSMEVGLRGPCNLFGHITNDGLDLLDRQLSQWDSYNEGKVTKIVFGHFPSSFIAGTKEGNRPEEIFAKHNILAYICGHLHYQFGKNLFKHHMYKSMGEFWEWELGDWKESRAIRIMAVDHGYASFLDIDLFDVENLSFDDEQGGSTALILITYPLDSRKMQRGRQRHMLNPGGEDSVRALIFSQGGVASAKALIYDFHLSSQTPVEELTLQRLALDAKNIHYFSAPMHFRNYVDVSPVRFLLKIVAFDSSGKQIVSDLRPFSLGGHIGKLRWSWKEYFIMGIVWDAFYPPLLWAGFGALLLILVVPKLYLALQKGLILGFLQKKPGPAMCNFLNKILVQVDNEASTMWWVQFLLVGYLMWFPWFWGGIFGDDYPLGSMSVRGWSVSTTRFSDPKQGLGVPDIIVIVLPFLYYILIPLFVLVFALYAEKVLVQIHICQDTQRRSMGPSKSKEPIVGCKICSRWLRKVLLLLVLGVAYLHAKRSWAVVGAYGVRAMLISPGYVWPVPILLVAAVLQSARLEGFCSKQNK